MNLQVNLGPYRSSFEPWSPSMGRVFDMFAYDTETTEINEDRPELTPEFVIATACDGQRGVLLTRDTVLPFFQAHAGVAFICHNAAFDLRVTQELFGARRDIYKMVDAGKVWDTLILKRLLSLATEGHTADGEASLAKCVGAHLSIDLDKTQRDAAGRVVRRSFGKFLYRPLAAIPAQYLRYAAGDTLATWHLFRELNRIIRDVLRNSSGIWGYVNEEWLSEAVKRHGPLTHHVQLKASIVCDELRKNGIGIDQSRQARKLREVLEKKEEFATRLRQRGIPVGESGSGDAMQAALDQFHQLHPDVPLRQTPKAEEWSTTKEHLAPLAEFDSLFADYTGFREAEKLASTYLSKMDRPRLHPRFGYLRETGRMNCGGGLNVQNLPRESSKSKAGSVRGCFVAGEGNVFIDADYAQIELVVLAYVLKHQFQLGASLYDVINGGKDVHRLIAAAVLKKNPEDVTRRERSGVKAISFGRPGGMGVARLQEVAWNNYGQRLDLEEVEERIDAYHRLCPELGPFLEDEVDCGAVIAEALGLTPAAYHQAIGKPYLHYDPEAGVPQGWLGWMLLKVLRDTVPTTRNGRPYSPAEIAFFWHEAQQLPVTLKPELASRLEQREPSEELHEAVSNWASGRPVFTVTGRIRARTRFCASRNAMFQGPASDGIILGLWLLWRRGFKLVSAIHDQVVVEYPADDRVLERKEEIEHLMIEAMRMITPGMLVRVESVISRSLDKSELDARYALKKEDHSGQTVEETPPQITIPIKVDATIGPTWGACKEE